MDGPHGWGDVDAVNDAGFQLLDVLRDEAEDLRLRVDAASGFFWELALEGERVGP